jgi:hypothetical protein
MSLLNIPIYECSNESDVEQKLLFPLLTHPSFLDIPPRNVLTKASLGTLSFVSKSSLPKAYVPDYLMFYRGYPVAVVEAKAPEQSVKLAISEARVYAQILNQHFPTRINPVSVVIGCNGRELAAGAADTNDCTHFAVDDLLIGSKKLEELRRLAGGKALKALGERLVSSIAGSSCLSPARTLDPQLLLERVRPNALAPYLAPLYDMFFRAEDPEKIQLILEQAYVDTAELREYDGVLHSMLRQIEKALPAEYRPIQTDRKREYTLTPEIGRYEEDVTNRGRMHLIIGSRGAGKSLFVVRFFTHLLPPELKERAVWCIIDFNRAPSSLENIEDYLCEQLVENAQNLQFDPYELEGLKRVFDVEINRLYKGPLAAISDESEREKLLYTELLKLTNDTRAFALGLARHITGSAGRPLIIAFDNVDRRESGQQLRIFQAAQWFRTHTRSFALLTLRDVTFERFKGEPPLDAFAQISNFYIRPPRFALVLQKRLRLAINAGLKELSVVEQTSRTGLRFTYDKEQLATFLQTVYDALFIGDQQVGHIVDALAERDVREALGMFSRMMSSGHFDADSVIKIGVGGTSDLSQDMLLKILMRSDYKLYSEKAGFIRNLFGGSAVPNRENLFLTSEILGFFAQPVPSGTDKMRGYWRLEELLADMAGLGFDEEEVRDRVSDLILYKMLAFDGEDTEKPTDTDLLKITPSGYIHLRALPYFIEYLSSAALHCPFVDHTVARRIGDIWNQASRIRDIAPSQKLQAASLMADYLVREKNRLDARNPLFRERAREAESLVRAVTNVVNESAAQPGAKKARLAARARRSKQGNRKSVQ